MPRLLALASFALAALVASAAASAQTAPAFDPSQVRRLSPEEKERILAESSERSADAALNAALGGGTTGGPDNGIHGELGFELGTGGTVGIYGAAQLPLGDRGSAFFSFEDYRSDTFHLDQVNRRRQGIAPK